MLIDKKASLELNLGTIPGGVGWGGVGSIMIIRLSQFNCNCNCLLELSLAKFTRLTTGAKGNNFSQS